MNSQHVTPKNNSAELPVRWLEQEEVMGLREYLNVLRKRWFLVALSIILCFLGGLLYTAQQPKTYLATAVVYVIPPHAKNIGNIKLEQGYGRSSHINTQQAIIKSRTLASKVISRIPERVCNKFFGNKRDQIAPKLLLKSLKTRNQPKTDLIDLRCMGPHPEYCALIANLVVEVFIEENNQQRESSQNTLLTWLKKEIPQIEKKMLENRTRLLEFEKNNIDILAGALQKNSSSANMINRIQQELQDVNIQLLTAEIRHRKCQEGLKSKNLEMILALDFMDRNNLILELRRQQIELEKKLNENRLKYKPKHPKIIWLMHSIRTIEQKILKETYLVMQRQEQIYLDLRTKQKQLQKMLQQQKAQSFALRQRQLKYDRYRREYEGQQKTYNSFVDKMKELDSTVNYRGNNIRLIDPAIAPTLPYKPDKTLNYLVSCILGAMIGIALAFILENLDESVKTTEEIQEVLPAPILGLIPYISAKVFPKGSYRAVAEKDRSLVAESFRAIATALFLTEQANKRCFVISSPMAKDGKSTVSSNLAFTIAKAGYKVLLVDGDLRRPVLRRQFGLPEQKGLSELLQEKAALEETVVALEENIFCVTAGTPPKDPYQCIHNSKLDKIVENMLAHYQYVLIDSPPIGITSDALLFGKIIQALLLVIPAQRCHKRMLQQIADRLDSMRIPVEGVILNQVEEKHSRDYYSYGYYHSYYGNDNV